MAALRMTDDRENGPPGLSALPGGQDVRQREEDGLLGAWLVGDDAAFGELVRRHEPLVRAIVRRYAATPEDTRDLVQRTFLKASERVRRALVRERANAVPFRRWLIRVAVNLARNRRRDAARWTPSPIEASSLAAEGPSISP
jgi:RNA polymerase sigma-70 factor (ECF subfamily)